MKIDLFVINILWWEQKKSALPQQLAGSIPFNFEMALLKVSDSFISNKIPPSSVKISLAVQTLFAITGVPEARA